MSETEQSSPIDQEKVKELIVQILKLEDDKAQITVEIAAVKKQAEEAGITKKQLDETLRLLKLPQEERDVRLSVANRCLKVMGKTGIDLNAF